MRAIEPTPSGPRPGGHYSLAVECSSLVFTAGLIPTDAAGNLAPGGIEAQARQVLENLKTVLESAGLGLDRVVKTTVYLADMGDFAAFNAVYARYFTARPLPARSTIQAARIPRDALIELDAVAAR